MNLTERQELESVQCGSCGARTAIIDARKPRCAYCAMPVDVPAQVRSRATGYEQAIARSRDEMFDAIHKVRPLHAGLTAFFTYTQWFIVLGGLGWWYRIVTAHQPDMRAEQLVLVAMLLLGPFLFTLMTREHGIDQQLAAAAGLSFAQLEVQTDSSGLKLRLRCPACGGGIDHAKLYGLTLHCIHCRTPLLAPSELVDEHQRHYYRRVLALRERLERDVERVNPLGCAVGVLYLGALCFMGYLLRAGADNYGYFTQGLPVLFFASCALSVYWFVLYSADQHFWWVIFMSVPIVLGPLYAAVMWFVEKAEGVSP